MVKESYGDNNDKNRDKNNGDYGDVAKAVNKTTKRVIRMTKGQESKHKRTYDIYWTYGQMDNIYTHVYICWIGNKRERWEVEKQKLALVTYKNKSIFTSRIGKND